MKFCKIRLADGSMAVYDIFNLPNPNDGLEAIAKGRLVATQINGEWRRAGRHFGANEPSAHAAGPLLEQLPVKFDMAPGRVVRPQAIETANGPRFVFQDTPVEVPSVPPTAARRMAA